MTEQRRLAAIVVTGATSFDLRHDLLDAHVCGPAKQSNFGFAN
jgi:hypothetical protein